jgi:tyrosine-protein phosphatase 2/3
MAANPFFDSIRQNTELSHGISERIPLRLDPTVRARAQRDLPFQWLRDIARRSDIGAPSTDADEGAEALAMQFYRIELAEQRRLTGIMQHHSTYGGKFDPPMDKTEKEGDGDSTDPNSFPYSITAGFEKGVKNRYRNIWPFEHARVRLRRRSSSEEDDDYVNASYVQPLGTDRRYVFSSSFIVLRNGFVLTVFLFILPNYIGILRPRVRFQRRSRISGRKYKSSVILFDHDLTTSIF